LKTTKKGFHVYKRGEYKHHNHLLALTSKWDYWQTFKRSKLIISTLENRRLIYYVSVISGNQLFAQITLFRWYIKESINIRMK
jgi:hypothetical protein